MLRTLTLFRVRWVFVLLVAWTCYAFGSLVQVDHRAGLPLLVAGIVAVSALVASIAGFAFCALAGSAFAYLRLDPVEAVQTMVLCSTAIQLYAVWKIRRAIRWSALYPML